MMQRSTNLWPFIVLLAILPSSHEICEYMFENSRFKDELICKNVVNFTETLADIPKLSAKDYLEISDSKLEELDKNAMGHIELDVLKLANLSIKRIAAETFARTKISEIYLENNGIAEIGPNAFNSTFITELNLSGNTITDVSFLRGLTSLRVLNLSKNDIRDIQARLFENMTKLEDLDLSYNHLTKNMSDSIFLDLRSLKSINLRACGLNEFRYLLRDLKFLKKIDLSLNFLGIISDYNLPGTVEYLNLSTSWLSSFSLLNLNNLITLDLNYNYLSNVEDNLQDLISLQSLYLRWNEILLTDNIFRYMPNLSVIDLDGNNLTRINFNIFENQSKLTEISISENSISKIPNLESSRASIRKLNFGKNSLSDMGSFSKFSLLESLDLSDNFLQKIEYDSFEKCKSLRYLNLRNNSIGTMPLGCFRDLTALVELDISHNYLSNISHGAFTGLENIRKINLAYNSLERLKADVFSSLKNLTHLDLSFNEVKGADVKKILTHVFSLKSINLEGIDLSCAYLASLITDFKEVEFVEGHTLDSSNIRGIACLNDISEDSISTEIYYLREITSELRVTKIILICVLCSTLSYILFVSARRFFL